MGSGSLGLALMDIAYWVFLLLFGFVIVAFVVAYLSYLWDRVVHAWKSDVGSKIVLAWAGLFFVPLLLYVVGAYLFYRVM